MSDNYLRLIPTDPHYIPPQEAIQRACALVTDALPNAHLVEVESHSQPVFIDQGNNLEAVLCPRCRTRLALYGAGAEATAEWWEAIADSLTRQNVASERVTMPCCGANIAFPELEFDWPAGVASFEISVRNPGIGNPLESDVIAHLERILRCHIRQVWAHY